MRQGQIEVDGVLVVPSGPGRAQVQSATDPSRWYDVDLGQVLSCQCRGFEIRSDCRHVKLVTKHDGRWPGQPAAPQPTPTGGDVKPFGQRESKGGYLLGEVSSALQKSIRRGDVEQALFWASELDLSGYGNYCFKRLAVIVSEDVGPAWPEGVLVIRALWDQWIATKKQEQDKDGFPPEDSNTMLPMAHAVLALCWAPKSRIVDNACVIFWTRNEVKVDRRLPARYEAFADMKIPDYALDQHTAAGRKMGRTEKSTYFESTRLENRVTEFDDPFEAEVERLVGVRDDDGDS